MAPPNKVRPWRTLLLLLIIVVGLSVWAFWPGQSHTPKLGLDLQGGTQVTLVPKSANGGGDVTQQQLDQAVDIIRQRIDGVGVAEAEVTTQGSGGSAAIVVSVPGQNRQGLEEQLSQTALLDFRPVVQSEASGLPAPTPEPTAAPAKKKATATAAPRKGSSAPMAPKPSPTAKPTATPDVMRPPIQAPNLTPALQAAYAKLNCADPKNHEGGTPDDPALWLVTCSRDGSAKYLLEPAFIRGTQIQDAKAQLPQNGGGGWMVTLDFDSDGAKKLSEASTRLYKLQSPQNQFAIVLDGLVQSSPYFKEPITGGQAQIDGNFTNQDAKDLANVLKYGALPVNLTVAEVTSVSPTLGADQLKAGLIAGAIGLALVFLYLLIYYRALGLVAIASLFVAGLITYDILVILSRTVGLALTLAGIAGAIVSIGVTADSFIVYFERIRDDVRERKSLRVACETGWSKARNTLLAADFVSLLAAAILYFISVGNVRGFAFTLGLTTIIDVVIAFMFTRPIVALLARNKWFTRGGPLTGVSPERLGVEPNAEVIRARQATADRKAGKSSPTPTAQDDDAETEEKAIASFDGGDK